MEELAAEAVEHLGLAAAGVGFVGLFADAIGEMAGKDRGAEEGKQSDPVLGVGDGERVDGREEEVVEADGCGDGCDDGVTESPVGCEDEDDKKQCERYGGGVGAKDVTVESYNTGKYIGDDEPASSVDHAFGVHRQDCTEHFSGQLRHLRPFNAFCVLMK